MPSIRLSTLGRTELEGTDGRSILSVLSQPKRFALLVNLAVAAPGGFVRRDRLIALFWPEHDQDRARKRAQVRPPGGES
jgi:DNA-binding SARP family transcriptional activator